MVQSVVRGLRQVVASPWVQVFTGVVLVVTAGWEVLDAIGEDAGRMGAHHGVLVYGLVQVARNLPDLVDGVERATGEAE